MFGACKVQTVVVTLLGLLAVFTRHSYASLHDPQEQGSSLSPPGPPRQLKQSTCKDADFDYNDGDQWNKLLESNTLSHLRIHRDAALDMKVIDDTMDLISRHMAEGGTLQFPCCVSGDTRETLSSIFDTIPLSTCSALSDSEELSTNMLAFLPLRIQISNYIEGKGFTKMQQKKSEEASMSPFQNILLVATAKTLTQGTAVKNTNGVISVHVGTSCEKLEKLDSEETIGNVHCVGSVRAITPARRDCDPGFKPPIKEGQKRRLVRDTIITAIVQMTNAARSLRQPEWKWAILGVKGKRMRRRISCLK